MTVGKGAFTDSAVWFNKAAFTIPAAGTFGTQQRNLLRNPGFWNVDAGLRKNFPVLEKQQLQMRWEIFNVFNHPNFGNPVLTTTSSSFGKILSTRFPTGDFGSSRQIQFALKLLF